jgi:hypothetical protein
MSFTEIRPHSMRFETGYLGDKVRVSFPIVNKSQQMIMYIGRDIAKQYGYNRGDRVILLVSDDNPFIWQVKKDTMGYKLGYQGNHLKLQLAWKNREMPANWKGLRFVNIEQVDGNMQISFPEAYELGNE